MKKQIRKFARKAGFSLIELIAVVAVIGILVAILVPKVENINGDAVTNQKAANQHLLQTAYEQAVVQGKVTSADTSSGNALVQALYTDNFISSTNVPGTVSVVGSFPHLTITVK